MSGETLYLRHRGRSIPFTEALFPRAAAIAADAEIVNSTDAARLFPEAQQPAGAKTGLLLLLADWKGSHDAAQDLHTPEGSYWHGILHRIEPDPSNASYWFRRLGKHPIFGPMRERAAQVLEAIPVAGWKLPDAWDPFLFIRYCEEARLLPGSAKETAALAMQAAEFELLFDHCRAPSL